MNESGWVAVVTSALALAASAFAVWQSHSLALRNRKEEVAFTKKLEVYAGIAERLFRAQGVLLRAVTSRPTVDSLAPMSEDFRREVGPSVDELRTFYENSSLFLSQDAFDAMSEIDSFLAVRYHELPNPSSVIARLAELRANLRIAANRDLATKRLNVSFPQHPIERKRRQAQPRAS